MAGINGSKTYEFRDFERPLELWSNLQGLKSHRYAAIIGYLRAPFFD